MTRNIRLRTGLVAAASVLALSAGIASAQTAAAPAASVEPDAEDIVVTGFRQSLESALNAKRNSTLIIESVTAEDIGKFPDQNISESLQRLPGIQIDRENGQGTKVRIRGLEQNVTVLNGELFITGQEVFKVGEGNFTRTDSLEGIPSELIGGVDVFKSPNASILEGGLGGVVNLKTRSALSLKDGLTVAGNVRANKGSEISGWSPTGAVVAGYNFNDRFGIIASVSYDKTRGHYNVLGGENRGGWGFSDRIDSATVPNYYAPEYQYATDRDQYRTRWGASLGLNFKPTDALELSLNYIHSKLKVDTREVSLKFPFRSTGSGEARGLQGPYEINSNGVLLSGTVRSNSAEAITFVDVADIESDNLQFMVAYDNDTNFRANVQATYSKASLFRDVANNDVRYTQYGVRCVTRDPVTNECQGGALNATAPASFDFTYKAAAQPSYGIASNSPQDLFTNPAYGYFKSHWAFGDRSKIDGNSIKGDFAYDIDNSDENTLTLSAGFRYAQRNVDFTSGRYLADYSGKAYAPGFFERDATQIPLAQRVPGGDYSWTPLGYFQDGAIGFKTCDLPEANKAGTPFAGCSRFGNSSALITPYQSFVTNPERVEAIRNFAGGGIVPGNTISVQNRAQMVNALKWISALYPSTPFAFYEDPLQTFLIKEETKTGYAMVDIGGKDDPYHINVGVRIVNTRLRVDQNVASPDPTIFGTDSWNGVLRDFSTDTTIRSYSDFLPSVNGVIDIADNAKLRFSAARVVSRQPLFDLGRGFATSFTRSTDPATLDKFLFTNGNAGNAELDPYRAFQFDLGFEKYFGRQGLVSAGVFWKEVDSFVVSQTNSEFVSDQAGGRLGPVTRPVNGNNGRVRGFEVAAQYAFDFGIGFTANYTFSDTKTDGSNSFDTDLPLTGVSKHSFNGQIYYENYGFSARASYSWRSKQYLGNFGLSEVPGATLGIYQKAYGQLDGQIGYKVTPNFEVFAEAINITQADTQAYLQFPELPFRFESGSRRIYGGVKFNF